MIRINLLPDDAKRRRGSPLSRLRVELPEDGWQSLRPENPWSVAFLVTLAVVVGGVAYTWWDASSRAEELDARIAEAREDSARLQELRALTDSLIARREAVQRRLELVTRLDRNRYVWPHLMDELSRALPSAAWLTSVQENVGDDAAVTVQGVAANPLAITTYVRELEASGYVRSVELLGSERVEAAAGSAQEFTLVVRYRAGRSAPRRAATGGSSRAAGGG